MPSDSTNRASDTSLFNRSISCSGIRAIHRSAVFADPYRFDIGRSPNDHVAFGFGAHFCIGTNLARAELRSALKALLPVLSRLELVGTPQRIANTHVSGFSKLPVRLVS